MNRIMRTLRQLYDDIDLYCRFEVRPVHVLFFILALYIRIAVTRAIMRNVH